MFTDIHTHAFHPKIARHAVEHLNEAYQLDCVGEGTIADLLLREKRSGIGRCVVLCAATTPGQHGTSFHTIKDCGPQIRTAVFLLLF